MTRNQTCKKCNTQFLIRDEDTFFYKKINVPPPLLCPLCREQKRLAFRNERKLYLRECGCCKNKIVSVYSEDKLYHVYCPPCFWSDKCDPVDIGMECDFSRPFFEQFNELMHKSKLISLFGKRNQNSDYVNQETDNKNCYLNVGGHYNEDCYYNTYSLWGKDNVDNYWVIKSQLLYNCVYCENCYNSTYLKDCIDCTDCHYCWDCTGARNCFGSFGLRHKEYYFFNKKLSKEEYGVRVAEYLQDYHARVKAQKDSQEHFLKFPRRATKVLKCENSIGDRLINCKDVYEGYSAEEMQDCAYAYIAFDVKDGRDLTSFAWGELVYNCASGIEDTNIIVASQIVNCYFSQYCYVCFNSSNLFGCIGLKRKEYCILNKQYPREEYEALLPRIIEHMKSTGEYGEFFPINISPFGYNETIAQEYFPLTQEDAYTNGYKWHEENIRQLQEQTFIVPDPIENVPDSVVDEILVCMECEKNFKIIYQELVFYRKTLLPLPRKCHFCRHADRLALCSPRRLWDRKCGKCSADIKTVYMPERSEIVYCEGCYQKEIY